MRLPARIAEWAVGVLPAALIRPRPQSGPAHGSRGAAAVGAARHLGWDKSECPPLPPTGADGTPAQLARAHRTVLPAALIRPRPQSGGSGRGGPTQVRPCRRQPARFWPRKSKKTQKNTHKIKIKSKLNQNEIKIHCATLKPTSAHCVLLRQLRSAPSTRLWCPIHPIQKKTKSSR